MGGCDTGDAKITGGYNLPARWVIHTVGPVWEGGSLGEEELLAGCYRSCLTLADDHSIRTIAFPAISTGIYRFPVELATRLAVSEVAGFLAQHESIEQVTFVCFNDQVHQAYLTIVQELNV